MAAGRQGEAATMHAGTAEDGAAPGVRPGALPLRALPLGALPRRARPTGAPRSATVLLADLSLRSASPFILRDAGPTATPTEVDATLCLPADAGPGSRRPAVVILHGLGGVLAERERSYGTALARQGYVTLLVDSFDCRGATPLPHYRRALRVTESMMLADAYAALRFLSRHPAVDPGRIALMGFSYGAMVAVFAAYEQVRQRLAPDGLRFAGHISYYGCSVVRFARPTTTEAPVLMLLGGRDDNVSLPRSRQIAEDLRRGGSPVTFTLFPDAYHQWDGPDVAPRHVRTSLARCEFRVEPDGWVRDHRTGLTMLGRISRSLMLAANVSWAGYTILQDRETKRRSDAALTAFLENLPRA